MRYKKFKETELFKQASIVIVKRDGEEVAPSPFDVVITAYPVKHPDYPHIPSICVEIL